MTQKSERNTYDIVVVDGGSAGITTAARLVKLLDKKKLKAQILIIDPAETHYYQPIWTLVVAGVYPKEVSKRKERSLIPHGVHWLQEEVSDFLPGRNAVVTARGSVVTYRYLLVCTGPKLNWEQIPVPAESVGKNEVCSNYSYETVESTRENVRAFRGGTAIFTQPLPPATSRMSPSTSRFSLTQDW
jgi:sulfide:quinone oxidoreductase